MLALAQTHIVLSDKDKLILCLPKGSEMSFYLASLRSQAVLRVDNLHGFGVLKRFLSFHLLQVIRNVT